MPASVSKRRVEEPAVTAGDYVVRYGIRGVLIPLIILLGWAGLGVVGLKGGKPWGLGTDLVFWIGLALLCLFTAAQVRKALAREAAFAVHRGGVYFGRGRGAQDVPWDEICAVEFFKEFTTTSQARTASRCVGVRGRGSAQPKRPGNGVAAQPLPERSLRFFAGAGRPDLIPGADGTIRLAYRKMGGWRVDRAALAGVVARYAPAVQVVDGMDWPPPMTNAEIVKGRRAERQA